MNKVSTELFNEFINGENEKVINWRNVDIVVTDTLNLVDAMSFVDEIVDLCFSDDGEYRAELKSFVIDRAVLKFYTNIDIDFNMEDCYSFVCRTDICQSVYENINKLQMESLIHAAEEKINLRAKANIEMLNKNLNELIYDFHGMQDKMLSLFENVNTDDISNLVKAISNSELDESKIVKAYIEQSK